MTAFHFLLHCSQPTGPLWSRPPAALLRNTCFSSSYDCLYYSCMSIFNNFKDFIISKSSMIHYLSYVYHKNFRYSKKLLYLFIFVLKFQRPKYSIFLCYFNITEYTSGPGKFHNSKRPVWKCKDFYRWHRVQTMIEKAQIMPIHQKVQQISTRYTTGLLKTRCRSDIVLVIFPP